MSTLNHDTELEEILGDLCSRAFNDGSARNPFDPTADIQECKAELNTYLYKQTLDLS